MPGGSREYFRQLAYYSPVLELETMKKFWGELAFEQMSKKLLHLTFRDIE